MRATIVLSVLAFAASAAEPLRCSPYLEQTCKNGRVCIEGACTSAPPSLSHTAAMLRLSLIHDRVLALEDSRPNAAPALLPTLLGAVGALGGSMFTALPFNLGLLALAGVAVSTISLLIGILSLTLTGGLDARISRELRVLRRERATAGVTSPLGTRDDFAETDAQRRLAALHESIEDLVATRPSMAWPSFMLATGVGAELIALALMLVLPLPALVVLAVAGGVSVLGGAAGLIANGVRNAEIDRELARLRGEAAGLEVAHF